MTKKIYVVKVGAELDVMAALCTTFKKATEIAQKHDRWVIEEWPMDKGLLPHDRREAWYCDVMVGEKVVPSGTLIGPYDGKITTQKRR